MAVNKNLFMYDLAVVAIMKNEEPYVKEWLDYHLLAGVDHFYIYDNDSTPEFKKILQPYIDAGIVTYISYPGKCPQFAAYNDAIQKYRFFCRYMAFIDGDEFIFPKSKPTVSEVVDELISDKPNVAGLSIHWQCFGSNGQEKADYNRGVLERFTRRAESDWHLKTNRKPPNQYMGNFFVKIICNPRKVNYFDDPHNAKFFTSCYSVDEAGKEISISISLPIVTDKIAINHYITKSKEECIGRKLGKADASFGHNNFYEDEYFQTCDRNEVFDDEILKYREARKNIHGGGG